MNVPSIPDNFHKFLLLLGLLILGYTFIEKEKIDTKYSDKRNEFYKEKSEFEILNLKLNNQLDFIYEKDTFISDLYKVKPSLIFDTISGNISRHRIVKGKEEIELSKELSGLLKKYKDDKFELEILSKKINSKISVINELKKDKQEKIEILIVLFLLGLVLFLTGYFNWNNEQNYIDINNKRSFIEKGNIYEHCQSCGKKFSLMRKRGKNKDKSMNYAFCSECYKNGKFTKNIKSIEDINEIKEKIVKNQKGRLKRYFLNKRFENLKRWKKDEY